MTNNQFDLAIIGSGASAIYLLRHLSKNLETFGGFLQSVTIFERAEITGIGMPYSPETTDIHNMSNIASEELPTLPETFVAWLQAQDDETLTHFQIERDHIDEGEVYIRIALGQYLHSQYLRITTTLREAGIDVIEITGTEISDIQDDPDSKQVTLKSQSGESYTFNKVIVATGHKWEQDDRPENGYYASPWPISKILPDDGEVFDFKIGTLGASLSAFDVISSLSHRQGTFSREEGQLKFTPAEGTENFFLTMHSSNGWLPHLQFDQDEPFREIYRHATRDEIFGLRNDDGWLRIDTYFDKICRPALIDAFTTDSMDGLVSMLSSNSFGLSEFVSKMESLHQYNDAFLGMRREMVEAKDSVLNHKPIHWKEVIDDLMYSLNYHAELMPAEDHIRFRKEVMPFLMNVIAAMPLPSGELLLALYDAGKLDLVAGYVEIDDEVQPEGKTVASINNEGKNTEIEYSMFINCAGQKSFEIEEYPFQSLVADGTVRKARAKFADLGKTSEAKEGSVFSENGNTYCHTGGIEIDASYRVIGENGQPNPRIHDIAFPHTAGIRPYSYGLQACSATAEILVQTWMQAIEEDRTIIGKLTDVAEIYEEQEAASS